jgi:hypothetical protein
MTTLTTKIENLRKQTCRLNVEETAVILEMTPDELMSRIWSGNFPITPVLPWADLTIDPQKLADAFESPRSSSTDTNVYINCP